MIIEFYRQIIGTQDNKAIGIALGIAIKDEDITSQQYKQLCREAMTGGFKFVHITFSI